MTKPSRKKRRNEKVITRHSILMKQKDKSVHSRFEALPNEIILHVFSYLKIMDLLKCGQISKRFRAVSNDEQYVWPKKLNLCYKKVPVGFLQKLLSSGCKYLSLSEAYSEGTLNMPRASRLQYLNLSGFGLGLKCNKENSEKLLDSCYSLQKLSLSKFHLSFKLINITCLQNGKTLKVLDLSKCTFCTNEKNCTYNYAHPWYSRCTSDIPIKQIVENCSELKELSLYKTKFCETSVDILVSNLTSKIEKLNLFDMSCLGDKHIKKLLSRCNKITELNLGGSTLITKQSLDFIIEYLQLTLVKLDFEYTDVTFQISDLFKLRSMEKLKFLCYMHVHVDVDGNLLKKNLPNIQVSCAYGNTMIASPCLPECKRQSKCNCQGFWEIKADQENLFSAFKENCQCRPFFNMCCYCQILYKNKCSCYHHIIADAIE